MKALFAIITFETMVLSKLFAIVTFEIMVLSNSIESVLVGHVICLVIVVYQSLINKTISYSKTCCNKEFFIFLLPPLPPVI